MDTCVVTKRYMRTIVLAGIVLFAPMASYNTHITNSKVLMLFVCRYTFSTIITSNKMAGTAGVFIVRITVFVLNKSTTRITVISRFATLRITPVLLLFVVGKHCATKPTLYLPHKTTKQNLIVTLLSLCRLQIEYNILIKETKSFFLTFIR